MFCLTAIKLLSEAIEGALRIGLRKFTTDAEVKQAADILISETQKIQLMLTDYT